MRTYPADIIIVVIFKEKKKPSQTSIISGEKKSSKSPQKTAKKFKHISKKSVIPHHFPLEILNI